MGLILHLISLFPSLFIVWQGDPIPEEIYEMLSDSSVRSISDLRRVLQIDSVGKSPQDGMFLFLKIQAKATVR